MTFFEFGDKFSALILSKYCDGISDLDIMLFDNGDPLKLMLIASEQLHNAISEARSAKELSFDNTLNRMLKIRRHGQTTNCFGCLKGQPN